MMPIWYNEFQIQKASDLRIILLIFSSCVEKYRELLLSSCCLCQSGHGMGVSITIKVLHQGFLSDGQGTGR